MCDYWPFEVNYSRKCESGLRLHQPQEEKAEKKVQETSIWELSCEAECFCALAANFRVVIDLQDDGLMVLCAACKCWQHALCFGIREQEDAPESHICEACANVSAIPQSSVPDLGKSFSELSSHFEGWGVFLLMGRATSAKPVQVNSGLDKVVSLAKLLRSHVGGGTFGPSFGQQDPVQAASECVAHCGGTYLGVLG